MPALHARLLFLFCAIWCAFGTALGAVDRDVVALLKIRDFRTLDNLLSNWQTQYEAGQLKESELRAKVRPLAQLRMDSLPAFDAWVASSPNSYFARLTRGVLYKEEAVRVRGDKPASATPAPTLTEMLRLLSLAEADLLASVSLAKTPVLSFLHLLHVTGVQCASSKRMQYLSQWQSYKAAGVIVRLQYLSYLRPRWCGSHAEMEAFIRSARTSGDSEFTVRQFGALLDDDLGDLAMRREDWSSGLLHLRRALEVAKEVGGVFAEEWLSSSVYYRCSWEPLRQYCPR